MSLRLAIKASLETAVPAVGGAGAAAAGGVGGGGAGGSVAKRKGGVSHGGKQRVEGMGRVRGQREIVVM
jgi:hypothetical protein